MKKILALLLAFCMIFSMCAFADDGDDTQVGNETTVEVPAEGDEQLATEDEGTDPAPDATDAPESHEHAAGQPDPEDDIAPTCTEDGLKRTHCAICNEVYGVEPIPALGHEYQVVPAQDPTCEEDGWEEYKACSHCDEEQPGFEKKTIPNLGGHKKVAKDKTEITCKNADNKDQVSVPAVCSVCGEKIESEIVITVAHTWEDVEALAPTCVAVGHEAYKVCTVCGKVDGYKEIDMIDHNYTIEFGAIAGDCTHDGQKAGLKCSNVIIDEDGKERICGEVDPENQPEIIETPGHTEEEIPAVAPTCESEGSTAGKKCTACGEILVEPEVIEKADHTWESVLGDKPSCTNSGSGAYRQCKVCGVKEYEDLAHVIIPAHGHSYEDGTWPENYDDEHEAYSERSKDDVECKYGDDVKDQKPATCTEKGYEPAEYCAFCDKLYKEGKEIDATGHDWELKKKGKMPTCVAEGKSDTWICLNCNEKQGGEVIVALGHALEEVAAELPTCDKDGHFAYSKCSRCDYVVAEAQKLELLSLEGNAIKEFATEWEEGKKEDVMPEEGHPFVIDAVGHITEPIRALEATCTENGLEEGATRCLLCNKVFDIKVIPAFGHDYSAETCVEAKDPTCVDDGAKAYIYCARCGKVILGTLDDFMNYEFPDVEINKQLTASSYTNKDEDALAALIAIPALGHDPLDGEAKEATCEKAGRTAGSYCARCGVTLEGQEEIEALGHDYQEVEEKVEPTCTKPGKEAVEKCSRCPATQGGEKIPALGHDAGVATEKIPATCVKTGLTAGLHCSRCEVDYEGAMAYLEKNEIDDASLYEACWLILPKLIAAKGHNYSEPITDEASCTTDGHNEYAVCKRCGDIKGEVIPATGHVWLTVPGGENTAPTCEVAGSDGIQQCAVCGVSEVKVIPALGHDWKEYEEVEATCAAEGHSAYTQCARCEAYDGNEPEIYEKKVVHDDLQHVDAVRATCKTAGHTEGQICSVCGWDSTTVVEPDAEAWHAYLATEEGLETLEWVITAEGDGTPGSGMRIKMCPECEYIVAVDLWPVVMPGDVNMDGKVNSLDALMILQYKAGVLSTLNNVVAADVNNDGEINSLDALIILNANI